MRRSLRSYRLTSCSKAATSPFLLAWTRSRSSLAASLTANCAELVVIFVHRVLDNSHFVAAWRPRSEGRSRCTPSRSLSSLHHDFAGHLRMDCAVVGIRSRFGKRVGEFLIRIQHLGLEHTLRTDRRMRNVITVCPCNCRSDGYRDRLGPENEIIDFHRRVCRGGLIIRLDAR